MNKKYQWLFLAPIMLCLLAACASCGKTLGYKKEKPLINAYIEAWRIADYKFMYSLLCPDARKKLSYRQFKEKLEVARKINGGVESSSVLGQTASDGVDSEWSMTLNYRRSSARSAKIRAKLEKRGEYWEIKGGGLLPLDMSSFDR
jgi:uncharacterized protein YbaR (Trm112 family)